MMSGLKQIHATALATICLTTLAAQDDFTPYILPASKEPSRVMQKFQVAPGLKLSLFAAEPMLANPVAFCFDERGRVYVAESFRVNAGVTDNRRHLYRDGWLDDELACRSVEDRVAMYRKHLGDKFPKYGTEHERVRLIEDRDGDGKADHATIFADGFNNFPDGIGAGLLARKDRVWFTCIPDVWLLHDADQNGEAERRQSLHRGYGVHTALLGHDLHGLRMGPDGKLYFSIGDRGLNVTTMEGHRLTNTESGAVLRCDLDGKGLEIFASGLRNPQELAFDRLGNLFTGDNNSDAGDKARLVYVAEGGDTGWRMSFQYLADRGPWNPEKLWHPRWRGQAAYILPPIANLSEGPSGFAYYPGTGLPARYDNHFLLCDFRGSSAKSGVHSLSVTPKGAGFELASFSRFVWNILATDVDFGPDGSVMISDWTEGWEMTGKGRLYRVTDPDSLENPIVQETKALLASGMAGRPTARLSQLLKHPDMRVRLEAQWALAAKKGEGTAAFTKIAKSIDHQLARYHAIWGLGQIGSGDALKVLVELLDDGHHEIRSQAAKTLGDTRFASAEGKLINLLSDRSSRVRYFAAMSLGKLASKKAIDRLLTVLRHNADEDPFLRHACVMGLVGSGDINKLLTKTNDRDAAVRMGILLALRRTKRSEVAQFLKDSETSLVEEAARAIHDVPITDAMPQLAAALDRPGLASDVVIRRAISANFRLGGEAQVASLCAFSADKKNAANWRAEALQALGDLAQGTHRDRVYGDWRPRAAGNRAMAAAALAPLLPALLAAGPEKVRIAAAYAAGELKVVSAREHLALLCADKKNPPSLRKSTLQALYKMGHPHLERIALELSTHTPPVARDEALQVLTKVNPKKAIPLLDRLIEKGQLAGQQKALEILAGAKDAAADQILDRWMDRLGKGKVPSGIQLDVIEAATERKSAKLARKVAAYWDSRDAEDPMSSYRVCVEGGNKRQGGKLFVEHAAAVCQRCHKLGSTGGSAGPELTKIGDILTPEQILEAMVVPAKRIAPGYGSVVAVMKDGNAHAGLLRSETKTAITLVDAVGDDIELKRAEIATTTPAISAMPPMGTILTKMEIRDLVAYLSSQKTKKDKKDLNKKD
ncbi:MAG: HEAT repeat domain-containing protein [Planctomycetota bacterium]|jgi:quinoprotein glucose dehydrogenase|nr:HEAT repeat domain-containing protein [Planctomycetota bacterium]